MNTVVIVAGGSGSRFKSKIPKQFLELNKKPVLMHSIKAFYDFDKHLDIILVIPAEQEYFWKNLCNKYHFNIKHRIVFGGASRFHSVKNALDTLKPSQNLVAVHDGVRPLVSRQTIRHCFNQAAKTGNAIPALPPNDSIREILNEDNNRALDRSKLRLIQTPQVFRIDLLKKAYACEYRETFTDDASVLEASVEKIYLVEGNRENIKITTAIDLEIAHVLIKNQAKN